MAENTLNVNNYMKTVQDISNLMSDETRKDVTFTFADSDVKIKAHKCFLEAVSPVFRTMFSGNFIENDEVNIDDITPTVFQILISGIYLKDVNSLAQDTLSTYADLYYAAEKYDIADIRAICKKFMMENCQAENLAWLLAKAKFFNLPDLETECKKYFKENTYNILEHLFFHKLSDEIFSEFLDLENLAIEREYDLYMGIEIAVDNGLLKPYSKCLSKIRFLTMETKEILTCKLLTSDDKIAVIANIAAQKHLQTAPVPLPDYLSCNFDSRKSLTPKFYDTGVSMTEHGAKRYWVQIMLFHDEFIQYIDRFNSSEKILLYIIQGRNELKNPECDLDTVIEQIEMMIKIFKYSY